ncbi:exodeoxyribonuclease IX [Wenzhouxiangella sp. XN79A]|uniref:5'-3' exonuclease n=1 Tax=Wenzhouxiangella sp. XN79A TaxID=2724193 RepID=UPI00144AF406|nr:5'-3' exonuclease H3TH domain-containing protein [Wenzhouxiangella sp. XN79A]NKI34956.1 exodeoxyribonuclease IX [Wenzhouxiangella sp. XN79A]
MPASNPPVHLVDASIYVFRAWYSMPDAFSDPSGRPTNAVYGFARFLCEFLEETGSRHVAVAFDESLASSFRNELYPDYKANRDPAPPELEQQFAWCKDLARSLGLPVYVDDRFEADDLIATLAGCWRERGHPICVVTGDKDLAQLVLGPHDAWWDFARRNRLDAGGVHERFGVRPDQIADYLALTGDAVDNIPGVPGIGPKTAAALLGHFGTLEALYARLDELQFLTLRGAKSLIPRLRTHQDTVRLARQLTGLDAVIERVEADPAVERTRPDPDALDALLDGLGFGQTLRQRLHRLSRGG